MPWPLAPTIQLQAACSSCISGGPPPSRVPCRALSSPQLTPGHPGLHWPNPHVQPGRSPGKPDSLHAQQTPRLPSSHICSSGGDPTTLFTQTHPRALPLLLHPLAGLGSLASAQASRLQPKSTGSAQAPSFSHRDSGLGPQMQPSQAGRGIPTPWPHCIPGLQLWLLRAPPNLCGAPPRLPAIPALLSPNLCFIRKPPPAPTQGGRHPLLSTHPGLHPTPGPNPSHQGLPSCLNGQQG